MNNYLNTDCHSNNLHDQAGWEQEKQRLEYLRRAQEGMRAMTEEEIAERQRAILPGMQNAAAPSVTNDVVATGIVFAWLPTEIYVSEYTRDGFRWMRWVQKRVYRDGAVKYFLIDRS